MARRCDVVPLTFFDSESYPLWQHAPPAQTSRARLRDFEHMERHPDVELGGSRGFIGCTVTPRAAVSSRLCEINSWHVVKASPNLSDYFAKVFQPTQPLLWGSHHEIFTVRALVCFVGYRPGHQPSTSETSIYQCQRTYIHDET